MLPMSQYNIAGYLGVSVKAVVIRFSGGRRGVRIVDHHAFEAGNWTAGADRGAMANERWRSASPTGDS
jgi:hypothetical protein